MTKVALITGGSSGIGAAVARQLVARRWAVVLTARRKETLEKTARQLGRKGAAVLPLPADVSQADQAERVVAHAAAWKGRLDAVINAAGFAPMLPLSRLTPQQWRQIVDTNLSAVFYTTRAVWPIFVQQQDRESTPAQKRARGAGAPPGGGVIVNISSEASRDPFAGLGAYATAKAALNMLTRVIAQEGRAIGVRAIAIAPAAVETPMFRALPVAEKVPAEAILDPADVAATVVATLEGSLWCASGETIFIHRQA